MFQSFNYQQQQYTPRTCQQNAHTGHTHQTHTHTHQNTQQPVGPPCSRVLVRTRRSGPGGQDRLVQGEAAALNSLSKHYQSLKRLLCEEDVLNLKLPPGPPPPWSEDLLLAPPRTRSSSGQAHRDTVDPVCCSNHSEMSQQCGGEAKPKALMCLWTLLVPEARLLANTHAVED